MAITDAEVVQATRDLHHQVRNTVFGQTQDIFDNPTAFDPRNHMLHHHAPTGEETIEPPIGYVQLLIPGLLFWLPSQNTPGS